MCVNNHYVEGDMMKMRWSVCCTALVGMFLVGGVVGDVLAQSSGRAAVAAKQKVRTAMVRALADGKLTRIERHSIMLKGKAALSPSELANLQSTLDRAASRTSAVPEVEEQSPLVSQLMETAGLADRESVEADDRAETVAYMRSLQAANGESPFKEETPEGEAVESPRPIQPIPTDDPVEQFNQYCNECIDECSEPIDSCGGGFSFGGMPVLCGDAWQNLRLTTSIDAFKGPMDLDNTNGNFGINFGINSGIAAVRRFGVGIQAGTSGVISDFHGTNFTGATTRQQNFTTVGIYRRNPFQARGVNFGFAYDWLHDKYYASFDMSQWRVKLSYELNPFEEFGLVAAIPNDGETVTLGDSTLERFKPVAYGNLFYTRHWSSGSSLTTWIGIAEEPGEFIFGGSGRIAMTERLSLVGNLNYVLPSASGVGGQDEEMWNVSIGIELRPGRMARECGNNRFAPLFSLANNGTFAIRRY